MSEKSQSSRSWQYWSVCRRQLDSMQFLEQLKTKNILSYVRLLVGINAYHCVIICCFKIKICITYSQQVQIASITKQALLIMFASCRQGQMQTCRLGLGDYSTFVWSSRLKIDLNKNYNEQPWASISLVMLYNHKHFLV